jgi:hypothetical protein
MGSRKISTHKFLSTIKEGDKAIFGENELLMEVGSMSIETTYGEHMHVGLKRGDGTLTAITILDVDRKVFQKNEDGSMFISANSYISSDKLLHNKKVLFIKNKK